MRFVRSYSDVCRATSSDRVYQGFSLTFDASVEELWMACASGAALVVGTQDTPRLGNDLAQYLTENGVTYFSTVPTVLSTMTAAIPTLKILVLGGEVCPPELVSRWARSGVRLLNTYGP